MTSIEEHLFDAYATPILNEMNHFPHRELEELLRSLPMEPSRRIDLFDRARQLYFQWSADAFALGLHLGLSLLGSQVCRPGPEKV